MRSEVPQPPPDTLAAVRALLDEAGYSAPGIEAMGIEVGLGVRDADALALTRVLGEREPLSTLVRLFLLGIELRAHEAERRLGRAFGVVQAAGLVARHGNRLSAVCRLTPWADAIWAHDPDPPTASTAGMVLGPNPAAETLSELTIRVPARGALDVGTGAGLHAVLAARHAERVVATDVDLRALAYTRLNAALNRTLHVETRQGSYFEPVAGERFDLVVSNPPFVISPERGDVFRFGERPRDDVSRAVVTGAAALLEEGGFAHVLCNWVQPPRDDWWAPVGEWVSGLGCDALLVYHATEDAFAYALRWNERLQRADPDAFGAALDRWLAYYAREGIEAIGSGALLLRRRQPERFANWFHPVQSVGATGQTTTHLLAIFAGRDAVASAGDGGRLLDATIRLVDGHRLDQSLVHHGDRYVIQAASLVRQEGLGVRALVDPGLAAVLFRLDGSAPLGAVVREVAVETEADETALGARAVDLARRLLETGLAEVTAHRS